MGVTRLELNTNLEQGIPVRRLSLAEVKQKWRRSTRPISRMTLIANTTVLSNFALIQHPELIRIGCPEEVVTAAQVMEEMRRGVAKQILPPCDWIG